jgi:hypothetical protein
VHSFDLIKSLFIYANYKKNLYSTNVLNLKLAGDLLKIAASLGSFAALNPICLSNSYEFFTPMDCFSYAKKAAQLYLTPGYLILAMLCYKKENYLDSLKYLILAEKLVPYSAVFINNAYRGKTVDGIVAASFGSWTEGIIKLASLADLPLSYVTGELYSSMDRKKESIIASLPMAKDEELSLLIVNN